MKRIALTIYILVLIGEFVQGQSLSVSMGNFTANPGDTVDVPVNVTNFNNIGAVSLSIEYDSQMLTYVGFIEKPPFGSFTHNSTDSSIITGWFSTNALNLGNSSFITLRFIYHRDSAGLNFNVPECEIADVEGNTLPVIFNNGSIKSVEVSSAEEENFTVEEFSLYQNYPNPFNPSTILSYTIPEAGRVILSVYTANGELVTELVNQDQKKGSYSVEFHAGGIASGTYIYILAAGKYTKSGKMILLR